MSASGRPVIITVAAVLASIGIVLSVVLFVATGSFVPEVQGPFFFVFILVSLAVAVAAVVGVFMNRRWGAWLYIANQAVGLIVTALAGRITWVTAVPTIIFIALVAIGLRRMGEHDFTGLKTTASTRVCPQCGNRELTSFDRTCPRCHAELGPA